MIRHDVKKYVADTDYVVKVIERHVEKAKNNLKGSPIIVAGGYGVGSKENFDLLFDLAKEPVSYTHLLVKSSRFPSAGIQRLPAMITGKTINAPGPVIAS